MKRFLLAFLLTSVGFHHHATAATCERRLGFSPGLTPQDQVRVLRQLAIDGCELIAVRFSEQSRGGGLVHSQVLLDLDDASLVRVIKQGGQRRLFSWRGVDRESLLAVRGSQGFRSFIFQGEASHRTLSDGALQLLR